MISVEQTKDFETITRLNETVQSWHHAHYPDQFKPFEFDSICAAIKEMMERDDCVCFEAKFDGTSCGYALCFLMEQSENAFQYSFNFLQLDQIAVLQEFQGKGVGESLVKAVESFARKNSIREIRLDHWSDNSKAAQFFGNSGFTHYNLRMHKIVNS